ncbi:MAG: hypothetical protein A2X78_02065 [Gammaproteobacteria bacterium GWE2_37_16]|nr:MAG: hypothetical protein A2X78_02065 [Gammaproteobacteria bacterium GWE2_37_16]
MTDIKTQISEIFSTQPTFASFATITEDNKPWVRYVSVIYNPEDMSLRFATSLNSRKVKQITKNQEVHLTYGAIEPGKCGSYLQIQGVAKFTQNQAERDAIWNPHLAEYFKGKNDPNYVVVIIEPKLIEFYAPGVFEPKIWKKEQ